MIDVRCAVYFKYQQRTFADALCHQGYDGPRRDDAGGATANARHRSALREILDGALTLIEVFDGPERYTSPPTPRPTYFAVGPELLEISPKVAGFFFVLDARKIIWCWILARGSM